TLDQARAGFMDIQQWLAEQLYQPVYEWQVRRWLTEDSRDGDALQALEAAGVDLFAHSWRHPRWQYIEPLKDAQADRMRHGNTLTSGRRIMGENGDEIIEVYEEQVDDRAAGIIYA